MVRFAVGILLPLAVGLPFTLWLPSWLVRIGTAFLGGMVIVAAGLTAVGATGLRFGVINLAPVAAVWLMAAALAVRLSWASIGPRPSWPPRWGWPAWVLLALTGLNVATAAAYAVVVPIASHDVIVIWLPKARVIGTHGFRALGRSLVPEYPPLWPLHIYLADSGGALLKLLPSVYLVATLLIVFGYVRSRVGPVLAAACAFAVSGVPYVWLPYGVNDLMSEIPTMAFVTASTIMLAEYVDQPSRNRLALATLLGAGAILVRPEGFVYAFVLGIAAVVTGIVRNRVRETLAAAVSLALVFLGWQAVVRFVFHYTGTFRFGSATLDPRSDLSSLIEVVRYAATYLGNPYVFGPALIAAASLALGYQYRRVFAVVAPVFVADLLAAVVIDTLLPTTDVAEPLTWWLTTGFKRLVMHSIPLLYVAAALAIGSVLQRSTVPQRREAQATQRLGWEMAAVPILAVVALTCIGIGVAGYAAYRVGGPKSYDLSAMVPAHVAASELDLSVPGAVSVTTDVHSEPKLVFYLQDTGRREPPLDNITGVFWRFSSKVGVASGSGPEHFTASVDGRVIGEATANPGAARVDLGGTIPIGGRFLELSVRQLGPGTGTASWAQPTVYRASEWWAVEAFLLLGAAAVVGSGLAGAGIVRLPPWLNPGLAAVALLAAAAVQQAEAMLEVAMPIWAGAVELVIQHL
jgi:hypothetical protein